MFPGQARAQAQPADRKAAASATAQASIEEPVGMQVLSQPLSQILTSIGSFSLATPSLSFASASPAGSVGSVGSVGSNEGDDEKQPRLARDDSDREATILDSSNADDPTLTPASFGPRPLFLFRFFMLNFN